MITIKQLQKIVNYFKKQPEAEVVFLFGSKAKGEDKKESDVDLAVLFNNPKANLFALQGEFREELKNLLGVEVDIVNMNAADVVFNYRVLSEGKIIYQRNEDTRVNFQTDLVKRYFDLKPSYNFYYQELAQRARQGLIGRI